MRVQHTVYPQLSQDPGGTEKIYWPDDNSQTVRYDTMTSASAGTFSAAPGGVEETLSVGDITNVAGVYIKAAKTCMVNINGLGYLTLKPANAANPAKLFIECPITSVKVKTTSDATVPATGVFVMWGDPPSQ